MEDIGDNSASSRVIGDDEVPGPAEEMSLSEAAPPRGNDETPGNPEMIELTNLSNEQHNNDLPLDDPPSGNACSVFWIMSCLLLLLKTLLMKVKFLAFKVVPSALDIISDITNGAMFINGGEK